MGTTTNLEELRLAPEKYTWGKIIKIHHIAEYDIIEYHPRKSDGYIVSRKINTTQKMYSCYINGKSLPTSCNSIDAALAQCIAEKYDGCNTQAGYFFIKMITQKLREKNELVNSPRKGRTI